MSQVVSTTPADTVVIPATNPASTQAVFFTVAELRAAMSPIGYMTPADQINAAAAAAAQATANAAIPSATLGQPLGPAQLDATGKVPLADLPSSVLGSSHYIGTWNASTNTPLIQSGVAPNVSSPVGAYYIVAVAGNPTIDGNSTWHAGDWIIWSGTAWSDISGQVNPVSSVAGLQGAISTSQLATALAGSSGLSSTGGLLNVTFGTTANTAAAGNDSRIVGAAQTGSVYTYLADIAAITSYIGSSPALRTAGYYTAGDGGGAFYSQTNTGSPAITDASGRNWYLQDIAGNSVNILQFGAKPDGYTDMQPGWAAADAFAAANNKTVFIPSGDWVLRTPMVATAINTRGEAANGNGAGTAIVWAPNSRTEQAAALTNTTSQFTVSDLCISGTDNLPSYANIVSSGWLPALASASCSFSGNVMTATGTTGSWAVGQNVCGPGMTNFCTITSFGSGSGGDGTYNLSAAQTVTGSITVTATGLPNLSAFKAGTACFNGAQSGTYNNCRSAGAKYGMIINTGYGHLFSYNCHWSGLFGVYCRQNGYDFYFDSCGFTGIWSCILAGTGVVSGENAGISFRAIRSTLGFSPLGIDILNDGGTQSFTGGWEFYGCSFESLGEALLRTLPGSTDLQLLLDMYPTGTFNPAYQFPTSIIGSPSQYFFDLKGALTGLKALSLSSAQGSSAYPSGSLGVAYIGSVFPDTNGDLDVDIFGSAVTYGSRPFTRTNVRNTYERDFLRRREQIIRAPLLDVGNMLNNPEVAANWYVQNSGSSVSVVPLSTLTAPGGALAKVTIPAQIFRESGPNPSVLVFSSSSTTAGLAMRIAPTPGIVYEPNNWVFVHAWAYSANSNSGGTNIVDIELVFSGFQYYDQGQTYSGGSVFQEFIYQGETMADFGSTFLGFTQVSGTAPGQTIYVIGLMASFGRLTPPNPLPGAYSRNGLYIGNENAGLTAAQAITALPFAGTPSGSAPNGSLGINVNATGAGSLYQYLNGAWVQIH